MDPGGEADVAGFPELGTKTLPGQQAPCLARPRIRRGGGGATCAPSPPVSPEAPRRGQAPPRAAGVPAGHTPTAALGPRPRDGKGSAAGIPMPGFFMRDAKLPGNRSPEHPGAVAAPRL
jgi:hypothetical protein